MPSETQAPHLVRLSLEVMRLVDMGKRRGLPPHTSDWGYLVHCLLGELFGQHAPAPFVIDKQQRGTLEVLGYSAVPAAALREHADAFAEPLLHAACDWERFASKRMPATFRTGTHLGFRIRACPTVRMSRERPGLHAKGAEVDAFLARCWEVGNAPVDREAVYREWLSRELGREGAAGLPRMGLDSFKRERVLRRTQGQERVARTQERPEAWLQGVLEVRDEAAFSALLRRGVGRHRAFGFGMVLLRPPETR
jgi:CRISPR system Cascade subunit CasE